MTLTNLTEDDIRKLEAGPELDMLVEVHVIGRDVWRLPRCYSTGLCLTNARRA